MGLFNKIKNIFKTENIEENVSDIPEKVENKKKSVEVYEKGLTKSREGFVSRLASLTNKYKKATDEYFDELEEILIMADIGVNTVTNFIEKLRDRVKHEKIESTEDLKEIIIPVIESGQEDVARLLEIINKKQLINNAINDNLVA